MSTRNRQSIDTIPGVTMIVRSMTGIGAQYEQFEPYSLDQRGAMLVLKAEVEDDAPIRVMINADQELASRYAEKTKVSIESLKRNRDGSFQLFGNWLKVLWTRVIDDEQLKLMGTNKLLWDLWTSVEDRPDSYLRNAKILLKQNFTYDFEVTDLLEQIVDGNDLRFPISQEGMKQLARHPDALREKLLYCLLGGVSYADVIQTVADFEKKFIRDPFQRRYGVLHGTMALNQGNENWEQTFSTLNELAQDRIQHSNPA